MTPRRVLGGYVLTLLAVACGLPVVLIGFFTANSCHRPGFTCLGFLFAGFTGASVVAVVALLVLSIKFGDGVVFWLTTMLVIVVPTLIVSSFPTVPVALLLAPGLGSWVARPREWTRSRVISRIAVLLVVVGLIPLLLRILTA